MDDHNVLVTRNSRMTELRTGRQPKWLLYLCAMLAFTGCALEDGRDAENAVPAPDESVVEVSEQSLTDPATISASTATNNAVVGVSSTQQGTPTCTGVLIARTLVLTAGHCLQGAIVPGHAGDWDGRSPAFLRYQLPEPKPEPGWTSGIRSGRATEGRIELFSYRRENGISMSSCQATCNGEDRCVGWTYFAPDRRCFLKEQPVFKVYLGNQRDAPLDTVESAEYSVAGWSDIAVMKLDRAVPAETAVPRPAVSYLGDTVEQVREFLEDPVEFGASRATFTATGFSPSNPTRRTVSMSFAEYPFDDDVGFFRALGRLGSTIEGGDSGSPVTVTMRDSNRRLQQYVIGVAQGSQSGGGRYVLTGVNKADWNKLVAYPFEPPALDLARTALIGEWLARILYDDFIDSQSTVPLFSWFSGARGDNYLTSKPAWSTDPKGQPYNGEEIAIQPRRHGYRMFRMEGYAFSPHQPQPEGTVPLWSWWSAERGDNFVTTNPEWSGPTETLVWNEYDELVEGRWKDGYRQYRLEGFVYDPMLPPPPGTRPLFSHWSSSRADNFATTKPSWSMDPAGVEWSGERVINGSVRDGYILYRLEGYVLAQAP
jgi:hypothetical protein